MAAILQYIDITKRVERQFHSLDGEEAIGSGEKRLSGASALGDTTPGSDLEKANKTEASSEKTSFYTRLPGVSLQEFEGKGGAKESYLQVDWDGPDDYENPRNWSVRKKVNATLILAGIGFVVTAASSIDSSVAPQAAKALGVSDVAETLATAMFLIGFGSGALLSGPLSELFGRAAIYNASLAIFCIWLMASALSPNFAAQIIFRFLAGAFGSSPLVVAGGSISDMFHARDKSWAFPIFAVTGFGGPILGPVIGAWIGPSPYLSWRWAEWIMLIGTGVVLALVFCLQPESMGPRLLYYKAKKLRQLTGDNRFKTAAEMSQGSIFDVLRRTLTRPFLLAAEPIVFLLGLYMSVVYIVLFTYLEGYQYVFMETYDVSQGITFTIFVAMFVGVLLGSLLVLPVLKYTNNYLDKNGDDGTGSKIKPEIRLLYVMWGGAQSIPIGIFWMGWTAYSSVSIWSPIIASVSFGYGIITVFLSSYMYIIDSYEVLSASALTMVTLMRYFCAGGMSVVGVPFYKNVGVHWTLTILGCISVLLIPVPYLLYWYGPQIRKKSKYAVSRDGE